MAASTFYAAAYRHHMTHAAHFATEKLIEENFAGVVDPEDAIMGIEETLYLIERDGVVRATKPWGWRERKG